MAKKIQSYIKLQIPAGAANPSPPVGPALGAAQVPVGDFVTRFNAATAEQKGTIVPVEIMVYEDRSFDFIVKSPPAAVLLKKAAKVEKGAADPLRQKVATVTWEQCKEIAAQKMEDLNAHDVEAGAAMIAGTARSMGIRVSDNPAASA